jgi:hypothetical protein
MGWIDRVTGDLEATRTISNRWQPGDDGLPLRLLRGRQPPRRGHLRAGDQGRVGVGDGAVNTGCHGFCL